MHIRITQTKGRFYGLLDFSKDQACFDVDHFVATKSGFFILDIETEILFQAKESAQVNCNRKAKQFFLNLADCVFSDLNPEVSPHYCSWEVLDSENPPEVSLGDTLRFGKQKLKLVSLVMPVVEPQRRSKTNPKKSGICLPQRNIWQSLAIKILNKDILIERPIMTLNMSIKSNLTLKDSERCRICLEGEKKSRPFCDACKCTQQMPVHFACLQRWVYKRNEKQNSAVVVVKNFNGEVKCEICQAAYALEIQVGDAKMHLFSPPELPATPHVAFTILSKAGNVPCGYVIIPLGNYDSRFVIGRAEECDIHLPDLSVSNNHAELICRNGSLRLKDLKSKYGSFRQVDRIKMDVKSPISKILVHKYLFEFHCYSSASCFCQISGNGLYQKDPWRSVPVIFREEAVPMTQRDVHFHNLPKLQPALDSCPQTAEHQKFSNFEKVHTRRGKALSLDFKMNGASEKKDDLPSVLNLLEAESFSKPRKQKPFLTKIKNSLQLQNCENLVPNIAPIIHRSQRASAKNDEKQINLQMALPNAPTKSKELFFRIRRVPDR